MQFRNRRNDESNKYHNLTTKLLSKFDYSGPDMLTKIETFKVNLKPSRNLSILLYGWLYFLWNGAFWLVETLWLAVITSRNGPVHYEVWFVSANVFAKDFVIFYLFVYFSD